MGTSSNASAGALVGVLSSVFLDHNPAFTHLRGIRMRASYQVRPTDNSVKC